MDRSAKLSKTLMRGAMEAAVVLGLASTPAFAQEYPTKPIRLVVEFPAGQGGDAMFRVLAKQVSDNIGQPIVVDNRPGAGGVVAALEVVKSAPDGYTLLAASPNALVTRRFLAKDVTPFDVLKDLTPITNAFVARSIAVTHPSSPFNTFAEMIAYAKANPGKLSYGTSGHGSQNHLAQEEVNQLAGVKLTHVPYRGMAEPLTDAMEGRLEIAYSILPLVVPQVKAGKVKVLGMVDTKRYAVFPDAPAISEVVPGWEPPPTWAALFGPANLPPAIARRIQAEFLKAMKTPEIAQRMETGYFEAIGNTPEEFKAQVIKDIDVVGRTVKAANIQPVD